MPDLHLQCTEVEETLSDFLGLLSESVFSKSVFYLYSKLGECIQCFLSWTDSKSGVKVA